MKNMKRSIFTMLLVLILCCGVTVGCNDTDSGSDNTDSGPINIHDVLSVEIDGEPMHYCYVARDGKEYAIGWETIYSMMYPMASEMEVTSNHLITFQFDRRYPLVAEEVLIENNCHLELISPSGKAKSYKDSILNISQKTNGTKLLGYTFELKFDEEDFDDDVIFVLYFRIYWNDEPSDKYYVLSDGLYVSMRPV